MLQPKTRMVDEGTISPKVAIPTSVLVLAGAVLFVLDALGVLTVDDTLWVTLLGAGGFTGASGYAARPGPVVKDET
jgi:hypothetical protein